MLLDWDGKLGECKDTGLPGKIVMYWFQKQRRKVKRETLVNKT